MKLPAVGVGVLLFVASLAGSSCSRSHGVVAPDDHANATAAEGPALFTASRAQRGGTIWADCRLFGTVGTPAHFKPGSGNFDELYNVEGDGTFKNGVTAISESKPGDRDFNGGRWHVNRLKDPGDAAKYSNACSVEELDLDDFEGTSTYFECPLLPNQGH